MPQRTTVFTCVFIVNYFEFWVFLVYVVGRDHFSGSHCSKIIPILYVYLYISNKVYSLKIDESFVWWRQISQQWAEWVLDKISIRFSS